MWLVLTLVVLAVVLVGLVWMRQRRHPVAPGRRADPHAQVQDKGSFWGSSPGIF